MFGNSVNQIGAAIADKDRSIRRAYPRPQPRA
jgi:hypothetical protein